MSMAVKMFKQMFLNTALLTRMLSIIILIVILSIPKAVSCFPNILFSTTLTVQTINQAVTLLVNVFVSETFIHTSHLLLPHFVDPTTLSKDITELLPDNYLFYEDS